MDVHGPSYYNGDNPSVKTDISIATSSNNGTRGIALASSGAALYFSGVQQGPGLYSGACYISCAADALGFLFDPSLGGSFTAIPPTPLSARYMQFMLLGERSFFIFGGFAAGTTNQVLDRAVFEY